MHQEPAAISRGSAQVATMSAEAAEAGAPNVHHAHCPERRPASDNVNRYRTAGIWAAVDESSLKTRSRE